MLLSMTQMGALRVGTVSTASGNQSAFALNAALVKLVNTPTVTLSGATLWSSVSAFIGGHPGYTDETVTFSAPIVNQAGVVEAWSNNMSWTDTASTSPQNYSGIVVTDSGSASVLFAAPFDNPPIVFNSALSAMDLIIRYNPLSPNASIVQVVS